jgi:hypothetical protein
MSDQDGFGNDGVKPARPGKSKYRDDHMKEKDENVAHARDGIKPQNPRIPRKSVIRHRQLPDWHWQVP